MTVAPAYPSDQFAVQDLDLTFCQGLSRSPTVLYLQYDKRVTLFERHGQLETRMITMRIML